MTNNDSIASQGSTRSKPPAWREVVARYQKASTGRAVWQLVDTIVPYLGLWFLMWLCLDVSWWLVAPLAVLAGGFMVRAFIIFHDCGHGSFFKSKKANSIVGVITGILTLTPYYHWRWEHAIHHSSSGDLDRRGTGDIWTLTVEEYLQASRWRRFSYRLARNPFVLFVLAPLVLFLFINRVPKSRAPLRERLSVYLTNLAIVLIAGALSWVFGFKEYLIIQTAVIMVAGSAGVWLFYVQHQFEGVYWERNEGWDYATAALQGSSFYQLPKVLQWFSGNIGFHHVHHLSPRIPNYHLEQCHRSEPLFQTIKPVTLLGSLKSLTFRLWDEQRNRLVGYGYLKTLRMEQAQARRGR
ncbi:MAG: fatty acid desaturase [Akkermansiaceae bacterium]|nr:fatty acid desaturase [Akkermansiaceae bacterium]